MLFFARCVWRTCAFVGVVDGYIRIGWYAIRFYILCLYAKYAREDDRQVLVGFLNAVMKTHQITIDGVFSGFFPRPGKDTKHTGLVCWEAPVALMVYFKGQPALGLGVEFRPGSLSIRQMQGVPGMCIPYELQAWPYLFVLACKSFVADRKIPELRIYCADQTLFYKMPYFDDGEYSPERIESFRQRMRRRYDGTARQMGFKKDRKWWVWYPPKFT